MSEFERSVVALLSDIKDQLEAVNRKIDSALSSNQSNTELVNSLFGFLQQPGEQEER